MTDFRAEAKQIRERSAFVEQMNPRQSPEIAAVLLVAGLVGELAAQQAEANAIAQEQLDADHQRNAIEREKLELGKQDLDMRKTTYLSPEAAAARMKEAMSKLFPPEIIGPAICGADLAAAEIAGIHRAVDDPADPSRSPRGRFDQPDLPVCAVCGWRH